MRTGGRILKGVVILTGLGCMAYFSSRLMDGPLGSLLELTSHSTPPQVQADCPATPQPGSNIEIISPRPVNTGASAETIAAVDNIRGGMTLAEVETILGTPTMVRSVASADGTEGSEITWLRDNDTINIRLRDGRVASVVATRLRGLATWRIASRSSSQSPGSEAGGGGRQTPQAGGIDINAMMAPVQKQLSTVGKEKDPSEVLGQLLAQYGGGAGSDKNPQNMDPATLVSQLLGEGGNNAELLKMLQAASK